MAVDHLCPRAHLLLPSVSLLRTAAEIAQSAQSVQQRAAGWTTGVRFSAGAVDFSLLPSVQTSSGVKAGDV
jgi:hypothetical protein